MSDQTEDTLPTDALEAEVAELIDEVERTAEAVEARLGDADEAVAQVLEEIEDAAPIEEEPTLDDDIKALIAEAERRTGMNPELDEIDPGVLDTPEPDSEPVDEEASSGAEQGPEAVDEEDVESVIAAIDEGVSAQAQEDDPGGADPEVEAIVQEATGDAAPTTDAPAPEPEAVTETPVEPQPAPAEGGADSEDESLDDELAAEADDAIGSEIAGEIETVDLGEALAAGDAAAEVAVEEVPSEPPAGAASDEAVDETTQAAEPAPAPARASRVSALLGTAISLLSRPLERLTVKQRDTIGWIALNVLFLAVCVWLYTLLR